MKHNNALRLPTASRSGFSLIELVVALVILAVGVLGLAAVTAFTVQNVTAAELDTERGQALQTVVEELRSMPFDSLKSGADTVGAFAVSWTVVDNNGYATVNITTTGPGLAPGDGGAMPSISGQVSETFTYLVTDR